jgi:Fur family transcriptional regulator, ferric uptake regulator
MESKPRERGALLHVQDYSKLLVDVDLPPTPHRLRVLEIIGISPSPLSHREIYRTLRKSHPINRVTIYRILALLVERKLVVRIVSGERSFRYGLAAAADHSQHPHFYCSTCGYLGCLDEDTRYVNFEALLEGSPGLVSGVEIRLDGICRNCLNSSKTEEGPQKGTHSL